jgi:preprotein translocase subunit SecG
MLSLSITLLLGIHVLVSLLIIVVVLMQRPKSEGLGAAFGGGMMENLFSAQASSVLANFTRWLGGIFFLLTLLLSILYAKQSTEKSAIQRAAIEAASKATPTPASTPPIASVSGTAHVTGTEALTGTTPFGANTGLNLAVPGATPTLLPAPTLGATPAASGTGSAAGH